MKSTKTQSVLLTTFDGGIANDPRSENFRYAQLVKNFDTHVYEKKLVPLRSSTTGDASASTNKIKNFAVGKSSGGDYRTYGLGVVSGGTKAKIFENNTLISGTWSALTGGSSSTGTATDFELFAYYEKTGKLYGMRDGTHVWSYNIAADTWNDTEHALGTAYLLPRSASASNIPNIAQGLVHSKDDILYIGYDNIIIRNNNGSWTDSALTLPTNVVITSLTEYGNYLAIAVRPTNQVGSSKVYLWDRDSSFTTISETIDWGEGNLQVLEQVDGVLVGISIAGTAASILLSRITFRYYAGGTPVIFKELISEAIYLANDLGTAKQKVNNYLYFFLTMKLNGSTHQGLWKVGKHISTGQFGVVMYKAPNNDTALTSGVLHGFIINGDYTFISYTDNGTVGMSLTNSGSVYTAMSVYESLLWNGGNASVTKKLLSATAITEAMPSGGQIVLKYKKDEETSYTTIFTNTTQNSIRHTATRIESTGVTLPQFKELSFRAESTGGAVLTGIKFTFEVIDDDVA